MKEVMGGAWVAGLFAWMLMGFVPALVCFAIGALAGAASWYQEELDEREAQSWRANYPTYKY